MQRALNPTEINLFRTRPQRARWYLAVHRPASLFRTTIAATPDDFPTSALTIDGGQNTGDATLTVRNQTVLIGDAQDGDEQGTMRLRGQVNTATSLAPIAESGSGISRYYAGKHLTVLDEYRPHPIMAKYDLSASQWRIDWGIEYEAHLEDYGPIIIMGPPVAGFLDENGEFTVDFIGGDTQFIDSTFSDCTWTFPDNQTEAGRLGTAASPVTKTFINASPTGSYFSLAVTDSAGASAISRRLIYCFASRSDVPQVEFAQITGGLLTPYKTTLKVHSNGGSEYFPDGAEILIFEEASYAGTATPIAGNYEERPSIVFRGWIENDSVNINPFSSDVTFNAINIQSYLEKTHSKDIFLANSTPPAGASEWIEAENLSMDRAAVNWGKHRSTVMEITDFRLASGLPMTGKIAFQDLPKGSLWSQIKQNYHDKGTLGYVNADLQGTIHATEDVLISGGSALLPLTMHIAKQDRRDIVNIQHPHFERNALTELYSIAAESFTGTSANPGKPDAPEYIGARSPGGDAHGYFGGTRVVQRGLVVGEDPAAGQQYLTVWSGNLRAKLNSDYPKVTVPLSGYLKADVVPQSRYTLSLSSVDNVRELDWNDKTFLGTKLTLDYNSLYGLPMATVELEEVVNGKGGSAITFPRIENPPPSPPPSPPPPPPPPPTAGDGFGTAYVFLSDTLARTRDLSATNPTWVDITGSITGTSLDFILDPWNPSTRGFALTRDGVWRITNLDTESPTYEQVDSGLEEWPKIQMSINVEDYIAYIYTTNSAEKVYLRYSFDAGDNWSSSLIADTTFIADNRGRPGGAMDIVPHLIDGNIRIYVGYEFYKLATTEKIRVSRSDDGGATWTLVQQWETDGTPEMPICLNTPYYGNEDGNEVWISMTNSDDGRLFKTENGFNTVEEILLGGIEKSTYIKRLGIEIWVQNNNAVAIWTTNNEFWVSSDGSNFSEVNYSGYDPATDGTVYAAGGFPSVYGQYYIVTNQRKMFVSTDVGSTWVDKTGNLKSIITTSEGPFASDVYAGTIAVDWTE